MLLKINKLGFGCKGGSRVAYNYTVYWGIVMFCRVGGIRTHDLQHPMLARYLATLQPENGAKIVNIFDFRIIECVIVYVADLSFWKSRYPRS